MERSLRRRRSSTNLCLILFCLQEEPLSSNGIDAGQLGVRAVGSVESAVHSMHALEQRMELQFARDEDKKNQALLNAKC